MTSLPDKVIAVHRALEPLPHAFGGALALAYYAEPRATIDIDVNVFVAAPEAQAVFDRLAAVGVTGEDVDADLVVRDGQVRRWWDHNPIDLFFSYDRFHDAAQRGVIAVPFADSTIPVLAVDHLVVCKVIFNRTKDWVDIDAIRTARTTIDTAEVLRWVGRIAGDTDPRYERIAAVLTN